jgi:tRNA-uridine aminocarboxypropyltransferase
LLAHCLCAEVPRVEARTRVVIVRHHLERWRSSNSGRLAHFALPNSSLIDHGGAAGPAKLPELDDAVLLFPEGDTATPSPPPRQLVVLDATWSQARRMYRKLDALRGLRVWRLPDAPAAAARLRDAPSPDRVSTIEAIAHALRLLESEQVAAPLDKLFALAVERARETGRRVV